jgi:hypothetical protein
LTYSIAAITFTRLLGWQNFGYLIGACGNAGAIAGTNICVNDDSAIIGSVDGTRWAYSHTSGVCAMVAAGGVAIEFCIGKTPHRIGLCMSENRSNIQPVLILA